MLAARFAACLLLAGTRSAHFRGMVPISRRALASSWTTTVRTVLAKTDCDTAGSSVARVPTRPPLALALLWLLWAGAVVVLGLGVAICWFTACAGWFLVGGLVLLSRRDRPPIANDVEEAAAMAIQHFLLRTARVRQSEDAHDCTELSAFDMWLRIKLSVFRTELHQESGQN